MTIVASPHAPDEREFVWSDEHACAQAATQWAHALQPGLMAGQSVVIHLHGTLGAGKTTFTRHLLRALGVQGRIKSPSYAVVEPHETSAGPAFHFDFYRFNDPQEWEDAGFRDLFAQAGLKLVEWPQKAGDLLPPPDLDLSLQPQAHPEHAAGDTDEPRLVRVQARSAAGRTLLQAWCPQEAPHV